MTTTPLANPAYGHPCLRSQAPLPLLALSEASLAAHLLLTSRPLPSVFFPYSMQKLPVQATDAPASLSPSCSVSLGLPADLTLLPATSSGHTLDTWLCNSAPAGFLLPQCSFPVFLPGSPPLPGCWVSHMDAHRLLSPCPFPSIQDSWEV